MNHDQTAPSGMFIYGPAHKVLVLMIYVQLLLKNNHADISSKARGLNFGPNMMNCSYYLQI